MKQSSLSANGFEKHRKQTRKATFLAKMDALIPWGYLLNMLEPYYPKADPEKGGRPWGLRSCCASTFYSTGSTYRIREWRMRFTTRQCCGISSG